MSEQTRLEHVARQQLGVSEEWSPVTGWTNRVRYTAGRAWAGQPWCVWFAVWCARQIGIPASRMPTTGSCAALRRWAQRQGRWEPWPTRLPAIALFNATAGSATPVHAGIVTCYTSSSITTIEGNAARPGQSQGSIVAERTRPRSRVVGVVYIGGRAPATHPVTQPR